MVDVKRLLKRVPLGEVELEYVAEVAGGGFVEEFQAADGRNRARPVLPVKFKGSDSELALNQPSIRRIGRAWGYETSKWVGKTIKATERRETIIGPQSRLPGLASCRGGGASESRRMPEVWSRQSTR